MSKSRKFSKPRSSTAVKVGNKNYNRKLKSGKIKLRNKKFLKPSKNINAQHGDPSPPHGDSDIESDSSSSRHDTFTREYTAALQASKRKYEETLGTSVKDYEKIPRKGFNRKKMKYLLPLKDHTGLIPQAVVVEESMLDPKQENYASHEEEYNFPVRIPDSLQSTMEPVKNSSLLELCAERQIKLKSFKEKIGVICSSVVENPEENTRKIKEVLQMLDINDPDIYLSVRKIACLSLMEVFKDIIPTYKIRTISKKEQGQKLKKETKQLREYEESLLRYYKQFLCKLEKMLECLKSKYKRDNIEKFSEAKFKAKNLLATIALKCLSELLITHSHFNFSTNILKVIVDRMVHRNSEVSRICCETIAMLFKSDKLGEISLEGVKLVKVLVKSRNFNIPNCVLQTFLSLNVQEAEKPSEDPKGKAKNNAKNQAQMMSRKEKKRQKKMKDLEHELREAEAEESKSKKAKYHTQILNEVFLIYFRVLKGDFSLSLLTPVLEGLAKFMHLINIDFFDDLISVLYKILGSKELGFTETLHCLKSVFTILSGQSEALNIDPQGFYQYLYRCLLQVGPQLSEEDVILLLQCIDLMIIQRRKKVTSQRVFAFLKRLSIISLAQTCHVMLSLLCIIRQLFLNFKQCDILLDSENSGTGQYNPDLEDPEYCHAGSTVVWEFHNLVRSHHPVVAKYAKHLLLRCPTQGQGQLHSFLALKSPAEVLRLFKEEAKVNFSLSIQQPNGSRKTSVKKFHPCVTDDNSITSEALRLASSE